MDAGKYKIIAASQEMKQVMQRAERVIGNDFTVLILGESGVGKELLARHIHENSVRTGEPFVAVNCGAIPDTLFEAEFFGYERGAFTNAFAAHKGFFEQGNNGTILLDEISELPLSMQVKLLRTMEEESVVRIGGERDIPINVRVIAASNRDLYSLVREGKFRLDLYYHLFVFQIKIPPLRMRKDDIAALAFHFLDQNAYDSKELSPEALRKLTCHHWPGNIRELRACILRAIINSGTKKKISDEDLQLDDLEIEADEIERQRIKETLRKTAGCVKEAAMMLGLHRNTIYNRARRLCIDLSRFRD